ncbi:MAG: pilus assembly protein TadG-related protein [Anaerolineales bacterium]
MHANIIRQVCRNLGMVGFAALALDGGMLCAERRHAQKAADASTLAAAFAKVRGLIVHPMHSARKSPSLCAAL